MRKDCPVIALDFPSKKEVAEFLAKFPQEEKLFVKVGMELFYREGPEIVRFLKSQGHEIFLDLKLHDIPHTVYSAMKNLAGLGVSLTNVHAAGGSDMMKAALKGLAEGTPAGEETPKLLAVTQLTSTSEEQMQKEQLIPVTLKESVLHYAQLAEASGLYGVVCSALEATFIHEYTRRNFACLTPGIRPENAEVQDQKRVVTPQKARELTSDFIVVGRPITQSATPYESYLAIKKDWSQN